MVALTKREVIEKQHCLRCDYDWWPKFPLRPLQCPNCGSAYWDRPVTQRRTRRVDNTGPPEGGEGTPAEG